MPPSLDQFDDEQLVRLAQQADGEGRDTREILGVLLARHQDRLYAVCLRMVSRPDAAADLLQETLVHVIRGLPSFDGRSQFGTWSTRIAMNACLSWLRRQRHRRHAPLPPPGSPGEGEMKHGLRPDTRRSGELAPATGVEEGDEHAARRQGLERALGELSDEHRAILVLRDVRGLEYEQIGRVLDLPLGTVRSRLFRARAALRRALEEASEDPQGNPQTAPSQPRSAEPGPTPSALKQPE